jgi:predicted RNA binding protein YcfA (HicA-like mRNA interferase family)
MHRKLPSLKPKKLISALIMNGCSYYREGKGDHTLYVREINNEKRVVPIDMGKNELSPLYVLRILRQFGFTDEEITNMKF